MRIRRVIVVSWFLLLVCNAAYADCNKLQNYEPRVMYNFWCSQNWVDFYWDAYDFDEGDWNDGFGYEAPCDLRRPLARTFQAIELVNYASPNDTATTNDFSGDLLRWGGNYTIREFDELDALCGSSKSLRALTQTGPVDNFTNLYLPFFYDENVVTRASVLVHEARHADWCQHNGNDGSNPCPSRSSSCDESYTDGCTGVGSPGGRGAIGYHILWLWLYALEADPQHSNAVMKDYARDEANVLLNAYLDVDPGFNISTDVGKFYTSVVANVKRKSGAGSGGRR